MEGENIDDLSRKKNLNHVVRCRRERWWERGVGDTAHYHRLQIFVGEGWWELCYVEVVGVLVVLSGLGAG